MTILRDCCAAGCLEDVHRVLDGWDPVLRAAVDKTPAACLADWRLASLPPRPAWSRGRTAVLGGAAHPFVPTSAQGAA